MNKPGKFKPKKIKTINFIPKNNQTQASWTIKDQTQHTPLDPKTIRIRQPIKGNSLNQIDLLKHPPMPITKPSQTKSQQTHPLPHIRDPSNCKTHTHWPSWPIITQKPNTHQLLWPIRAQQPKYPSPWPIDQLWRENGSVQNGQRKRIWIVSHHYNGSGDLLLAAVKGWAWSSLVWRSKLGWKSSLQNSISTCFCF